MWNCHGAIEVEKLPSTTCRSKGESSGSNQWNYMPESRILPGDLSDDFLLDEHAWRSNLQNWEKHGGCREAQFSQGQEYPNLHWWVRWRRENLIHQEPRTVPWVPHWRKPNPVDWSQPPQAASVLSLRPNNGGTQGTATDWLAEGSLGISLVLRKKVQYEINILWYKM